MADSQRERYRLERKISGKGGFGEVWLATDTLLDRSVAIKCPKATDNPTRRERFLIEARILARLSHPNITQIYDAFFNEDENSLYLVIEYVDGKDLSEIISESAPLPLDIILEIAMGILKALSYAHEQGLVHRDVKSANVMIGDDVKLTDFGLAALRSILQEGTDFLAGTPAYMAPEQIEGQATDGRADLYALGVILFEMISGGRLPFERANLVDILDAHLQVPPPPISQFEPTVPPVLEQVITRLLAKDPEDRYPSADVVMEVLDTIHIGTKLGNLPVPLTPFVGREAELAEIEAHLRDPGCRLLTLVGPGGSGKTCLAREAAAAQADNYPHGAFFVPLAPLDSVEGILPTVAEALGFRFYEESEPRQQLLDYLRQKHMLLILDNFEHLLACPEQRLARPGRRAGQVVEGPGRGDGVGLVTDILQTAPDVKVLATSRARLNVRGEHLFPVAGMKFPDREKTEDTGQLAQDAAPRRVPRPVGQDGQDVAQYGAVKLFLQSARQVRPRFEPTADEMLDIEHICRLVAGMPLAILLAAAWMEILTPSEIVAGIRQSIDFLETDLVDVPARQHSMRAVFDHSWQLLTEREKVLFARLSVFRGGFTREAVREVTGTSLRDLMALVSKSLLHRASRGRYEVHELLRAYAAEKLSQSLAASEVVRDRHCAYYTAALQRWRADFEGPRQQAALAEMDTEIENARHAWDWAVERAQVEQLDRAIVALWRFYMWRGRYQEGETVCRIAAEKLATRVFESAKASGDGLRVLAQVLSIRSNVNWMLGRTKLCSQLLRQSLALLERSGLDDPDTRLEKAYVLLEMGRVASDSDPVEATRLYEQSLTLFRALDDRWGTAAALYALGKVAQGLGAYAEARQFHEDSLTIRQALGDQRALADSLAGLGAIALYQGEFTEAEHLMRESIAIHQEIGNRAGIAGGLSSLGTTFIFLGKFAKAASVLQESATVYNELGSRPSLALSTITLGHAKAHSGEYEQARVQGEFGLNLSRKISYQRGIGHACWLLGYVALAEETYIEAEQLLQKSVATFRELGQREELGSVLGVLGMALCGLSQLSQARQHLQEALHTATQIRGLAQSISVLRGIALLLAERGDVERAVELYALVSRYPIVSNSRLSEDTVGRHIAAVAAGLPPEVVAVAQERGRTRDIEATVAELLAELEG
jgi:predicted ATPase